MQYTIELAKAYVDAHPRVKHFTRHPLGVGDSVKSLTHVEMVGGFVLMRGEHVTDGEFELWLPAEAVAMICGYMRDGDVRRMSIHVTGEKTEDEVAGQH